MPKVFNPQEDLRIWNEFGRGYEQSRDFEKVRDERRLSYYAVSALSQALHAWLLGQHAEIRPVLEKTRYWLQWAEDAQEPVEVSAVSRRNEALARAIWMLEARIDRESYRRALDAYGKVLDDPEQHYSRNIDHYLSLALQSGDYERGIARYEALGERTDVDLKTAKSPRAIAYVLCRHLAFGEGELAPIKKALAGMLRRYCQSDWMGNGNYRDPATWLKVLYWDLEPNPPSPETVIYRAYDHMPKVVRPPWVPATDGALRTS